MCYNRCSQEGLCRSPHGERGLKFNACNSDKQQTRRSPHGERGLKFNACNSDKQQTLGRSPHGERGLKYNNPPLYIFVYYVALLTESVD